MAFHVAELCRVTTGMARSLRSHGNNGAFDLESPESGWRLAVIASDGKGWEHVSVRAYQRADKKQRIPNWREMCYVKNLFWDDEDTVIQIHPPKSQYVNQHPHVLHLWRPIGKEIPLPHPAMVGLQDGKTMKQAEAELELYEGP